MGWVKTLALVLLVAQNASLVLTMRKARTDEVGVDFLSLAGKLNIILFIQIK